MQNWIRAALIGTACVVLSSGVQPWIDAASGAFVPADIAQDAAAARLFLDRINPYGPEIRESHSRLTGMPVGGTFPYFPHPPFSLIVSLPLAYVPYRTGAVMWFGFTLALLFVLAALLAEMASGRTHATARSSSGHVWIVMVLLLAWPPVLYNLEKGQWSILLTVLMALGWRAVARGNFQAGGAWIGAAAAIKVFPVVMGAYLLLRSRRAAGWFVAVGLILTGIPLLWIGIEAFPAFVRQSQLNMPYWESFPSVTLSIHGAVARLFIGGQWAQPLIHAPALAAIVDAAIMLPLLGGAVHLTRRATRGQLDDELAFAIWVVLLPMLNPQSLGHNGVLLAIPLTLLYRRLLEDPQGWARWGWGVALVLISIPRQTLWRLAPPPIQPLEGIALIALPMWGALLLVSVIVAVSRVGRGAPARRQSLVK